MNGPRFCCSSLVSTDGYLPAAIVLGWSLRRAGWSHETVVMVTDGVSAKGREALKRWWGWVIPVDTIAAPAGEAWKRRFLRNFTKLRAWQLTDYDKVIFLDADTIVLGSLDALLERPDFAAAPCVFPPDSFNTGSMVLDPSDAVYEDMIAHLREHRVSGFGDQGFLNRYYPEWYTGPPGRRLPVTYNVNQLMYRVAPVWNELKDRMRVLHFAGRGKPWDHRWGWLPRLGYSIGPRRGFGDPPGPWTFWWRGWEEVAREDPHVREATGLGPSRGWGVDAPDR